MAGLLVIFGLIVPLLSIPTPMPMLAYHVVRTQRKTLSLRVLHDSIEVRAPLFLPDYKIQQWVASKQAWINNKQLEQQRKAAQKPLLEHGRTIPFLGMPRRIVLQKGNSRVIECNNDLRIFCRDIDNTTQIQQSIERWLKNEACAYMQPRILELAEMLGVSHKITAIYFRRTKSKWGHCTSAGALQFNWLVMMAPIEVIDYLIIHELCHLTHMNHSAAFWRLVQHYCPDFHQQRQWLKQQGHTISF